MVTALLTCKHQTLDGLLSPVVVLIVAFASRAQAIQEEEDPGLGSQSQHLGSFCFLD